jgi:AraC-like DNA-binding protein
MRYHEVLPSLAAARHIKCYWVLEDDSRSREPQRIVPDGRCELILNFAQPFASQTTGHWQRQPQSFFVGQITGPLLLRPGGPVRVVGIRFHPHGASAFLGLPVRELTNTIASIESLSLPLHRESQRLLDSGSPSAALTRLDKIFSHSIQPRREDQTPVVAAVHHLERAAGCVRVTVLARNAGLSLRQFQRRFRDAVGISPKLFSRMQRFQRVFQATEAPDADWAGTALQSGYFDQAHLIRDFREFAGMAPTSLLAGEVDLARRFLADSMSHFSNTVARPAR